VLEVPWYLFDSIQKTGLGHTLGFRYGSENLLRRKNQFGCPAHSTSTSSVSWKEILNPAHHLGKRTQSCALQPRDPWTRLVRKDLKISFQLTDEVEVEWLGIPTGSSA